MTLLEGLRAYLVAQAGVTAVVSTRVRTTQADEADALPYVLLFLVSDVSLYAMAGPAGLVQARVQIDCIGATPKSALDVSEAAHTVLSGYRGDMGTVPVRRCHKVDRGGPELFGPHDGSQVGKYRVRMDYHIDYHE